MDALELLQQDHRTVKELLREAKESDDPKKTAATLSRDQNRAGDPCQARRNDLLPGHGRARRVEGNGSRIDRGA